MSHRFSLAKHKKRREDLILEDPVPDLSTLATILGGIAPAQRPLRPVRSERKPVTLQDLSGQEVENALHCYFLCKLKIINHSLFLVAQQL